jgi:hypothetical protein
MTTEIEQIDSLLQGCGNVHVQFSEFKATHGYLHILLTGEGFQRKGDIYLTDCEFISGPTAGGPWVVRLRARADGEGVEVSAGERTLVVLAGRVSVEIGGRSR